MWGHFPPVCVNRISMEKSSLYPKAYGTWAGNPTGRAPDYTLCCEEVSTNEGWSRRHQCCRKRGFGPDGAYCKQHDPDAVKARHEVANARRNKKWSAHRHEIHGRTFFEALVKIADGHDDPRGLAQSVIDDFKKGESR